MHCFSKNEGVKDLKSVYIFGIFLTAPFSMPTNYECQYSSILLDYHHMVVCTTMCFFLFYFHFSIPHHHMDLAQEEGKGESGHVMQAPVVDILDLENFIFSISATIQIFTNLEYNMMIHNLFKLVSN